MTTINSEWKTVRIGDLGDVVTGGTPSTKKPEFFGDLYPFITPTDMDYSLRHIETERFLSDKGRQNQIRKQLPAGAVCFVCIGTIGKVCMTHSTSFTNQQINSVVVDTKRQDSRFVYYLLSTLKDRINGIAAGTATPIVNKSSFSDVEVSVPSKETQGGIASILSAYDNLIENNLRRIKILEEMAQNLYREWFVKFRFPGHEHVRMVDSPLGEIPEGWEVRRLSEVCNLVMGQSPKSEFYNDVSEGLPFHQGVTDFGDRFPTTRLYCTMRNRLAEAGDILFSVRAPVGRINIAPTEMVIGRGLSAIQHSAGFQWFAFHQLRETFKEEDSMGGGTIFKAVTKADMQRIEFLSADDKTLRRFEEMVSPFENQIKTLTKKNETLCQTRDLLLPKLISGELDVSELDIDIREAA